jgi:hypothetical protein
MSVSPLRHRSAPARTRRIAEVLTIGAVIGGVWWRWWVCQNAVPDVAVPPLPPTPAVNGYDVMVRALGLAAACATAGKEGRYYSRETSEVTTEAGKEAVVSDYRPAIDAVHQVLLLPWQLPIPRAVIGRQPSVSFAGIRNTLRNCVLAGDVRVAHGDVPGALRTWGDAMQFSADLIPRGGEIGASMQASGCESIGRQPFWSMAGSLNAADARAAALRIERINDQRIPLTACLTNEKWYDESIVLDEMRTRSLPHLTDLVQPVDADRADADSKPSPASRWVVEARLLMKSKTAVLNDHAAYMDAQIARAALPRGAFVHTMAAPMDPINATFLTDLGGFVTLAIQEQAAARTQDALLATTLALRACRVEHGAYPASLSALVDGVYLTHLPVDAFDAAGAPVRYRVANGDRYLLYSVGPDGRDDGGRPIVRFQSYYIASGVVPAGDVVAGVNVW